MGHRRLQEAARAIAGPGWHETGTVFTSSVDTPLDAANVRRAFRHVAKGAGLDPTPWTPRELRGHAGTAVTEKVYRHQLRPVLLDVAIAMDQIFEADPGQDG